MRGDNDEDIVPGVTDSMVLRGKDADVHCSWFDFFKLPVLFLCDIGS